MTWIRDGRFAWGLIRAWREELGDTEIALWRGCQEIVLCVLWDGVSDEAGTNHAESYVHSSYASMSTGYWLVDLNEWFSFVS